MFFKNITEEENNLLEDIFVEYEDMIRKDTSSLYPKVLYFERKTAVKFLPVRLVDYHKWWIFKLFTHQVSQFFIITEFEWNRELFSNHPNTELKNIIDNILPLYLKRINNGENKYKIKYNLYLSGNCILIQISKI